MTQSALSQPLGKFQLIAELGHGGMADVYLAVAKGPAGFSKLQVVKQLRPNLAENPEVLAMFMDEARLAARLNHPNVVQTFEVEHEGNRCYLAMEYLEGQPLDRVLRRAKKHEPLPLSMQLRICIDTLAGLHHAHELCDYDGTPLHVVHRDISPQNVFITYEGQIKVVDFGIAKAVGASAETRTGVLKGKIAYMAPEQALGDPLDRRADIFCVGILLFEALVGRRMWEGVTDIQILHRLANDDLPRLPDDLPGVPAELRRICAKALSFKPDGRHATAAQFQAELERYLDAHQPTTSREVGARVAEMFQDKREQVRAIIDSQLSALRGSSSGKLRAVQLPTNTVTISAVRPDLHTPSNLSSTTPPVEPARSASALYAASALALLLAGGGLFLLRSSAAPAPLPPAASAPAVNLLELKVRAVPAQASLFLDDAPLAGNPFSGKFPRDGATHRLRAEAPGFAPLVRLVPFDGDQSVELTLDPRAAPSAPASAPPREDKADKADKADPRPARGPGGRAAPTAATATATATSDPDALPPPSLTGRPKRDIDKDDPWK